jgi:hypothetical protein
LNVDYFRFLKILNLDFLNIQKKKNFFFGHRR